MSEGPREHYGNAWRWALVAALFAITIINYVDRQSLSLLAPSLQAHLQMNDRIYAHIVSAFLIAYTFAYLFAGRLCDRIGSRASMSFFVLWWSLAEMLPPFARNGFQLGTSRFLLGLGEAGNYVAAPKTISEHFNPAERGLALGIYTAGASLGATLAPPLIALLSDHSGWTSVFFATGIAGLLWIVPWLWISRRTPRPITDIAETKTDRGSVWADVFRTRDTWLLLLTRFITDPVWYFFLFWFPKYLQQVRGLTLTQTGHSSWIVYLAADIGMLAGGWFCGPLIRKGFAPLRARRLVMTCAAALMPLSPLAALLTSISASLTIASIIAFAHMAWLVVLTAIVLDQFPASRVGTAAGVIAFGSGLGGILSAEILGRVIPAHGYTSVFFVAGALHPLALLLLWQIRASTPTLTRLFPTPHLQEVQGGTL